MCPSHLPSLPREVISSWNTVKPWNFRPYNWSFASCNDGGARCIWPRVEMVGALRCRFSCEMLDSLQSKKHFPPEETSWKIHQYPSISIINPFIPVNLYAIYLVLNGWWIIVATNAATAQHFTGYPRREPLLFGKRLSGQQSLWHLVSWISWLAWSSFTRFSSFFLWLVDE